MSDMNLTSVTVERFCDEIKEAIEDGCFEKPFLGLGKTGIGKTESIAQVAKELGIGFKEIRLINHGETDMIGVPMLLDTKTGMQAGPNSSKEDIVTAFCQNDLLPVESKDGEVGILVLDEITSASINMRTIAYQLLDTSRGVGDYKLPKKWLIVALGNGMNDGGNFQGIEPTLFSRCICFNVVADLAVWKRWAVKQGVSPSVLAFLSFDPSMLHSLNADDEPGVICCPRSWKALSDILQRKEKRLKKVKGDGALLDDMDIAIYAGACIGEVAARKFMAFYRYNKDTVNPEDILSGKAKASEMGHVANEVMHLVIQSLVNQIGKEMELLGVTNGDPDLIFENKEFMGRLSNAFNWAFGLGKSKMLDMSFMFFKEITSSIPILSVVIASDEIDEFCPELESFLERNEAVTMRN